MHIKENSLSLTSGGILHGGGGSSLYLKKSRTMFSLMGAKVHMKYETLLHDWIKIHLPHDLPPPPCFFREGGIPLIYKFLEETLT